MINRTHTGVRCHSLRMLRTVKGNLPRASPGTVVYEMGQFGEALDCGDLGYRYHRTSVSRRDRVSASTDPLLDFIGRRGFPLLPTPVSSRIGTILWPLAQRVVGSLKNHSMIHPPNASMPHFCTRRFRFLQVFGIKPFSEPMADI